MSNYTKDEFYVYIFVRKDLTPGQQLIQSCHSVAESAKHYFHTVSQHPNFVACGVKDESALLKVIQKLEDNGIRHKTFRESDLDDQFTSVSTEPVYGESRRLFKNYQLLQPQEDCVL